MQDVQYVQTGFDNEGEATMLKTTKWGENLIKLFTPSDSRPPRFYGVPKIHKENTPLRSIVGTIEAPAYKSPCPPNETINRKH